MTRPVSPSRSLVEFCYHVAGTDPLAVIDAACEEIGLARRLHRAETGQRDFRSGSKGRRYCDQLQHLVFLLMNGQIPRDAPATFRRDVTPLVKRLLQHWDIGELRQEFTGDV
ncbi:MAG: hypothetical protein EON58_03370 [Alphaproteobacteria bacterium]|nr:MAG: hypothetical protein EON58_03370 [Alphaproteobacteria bacterium]